MVDNTELSYVTIVGRLNNMTQQSTHTMYNIDDGTAALEVKRFYNSNDQDDDETGDAQHEEVVEGTYVRAIGNIKAFGQRKILVAFKVVPVTSMDEITYHSLECMMVHLALSRGVAPTAALKSATLQSINTNQQQQHLKSSDYAPQYGGQAMQGVQIGDSMFTPLQNEIMKLAQQCGSDPEGADMGSVLFRLRGMSTEADIRSAVDWLISEGHLYNTSDDDHFLPTHSG